MTHFSERNTTAQRLQEFSQRSEELQQQQEAIAQSVDRRLTAVNWDIYLLSTLVATEYGYHTDYVFGVIWQLVKDGTLYFVDEKELIVGKKSAYR